MKATVIINTIKETPERLMLAINSYKNQVGVSLQIIISTIEEDTSIKIAKQMGCDVVINPEKGIYKQLNNAINYIKYDWWCYASGHDIAIQDKIRDEINCCLENNKLICYSNYNLVDPQNNISKEIIFPDYNNESHLKGNFVNDCAIINTALTRKYAPFQSDKWHNDSFYDFWLRIYEGEGDVFIHNNKPTWNYIQYSDSKHLVRQKNENELQQYRELREEMIKSHIERPLITVALPTYASKIVWLALEGLSRQRTNIKWELLICEDRVEGHGESYYKSWESRLQKAGCVNLKYIEVVREDNISNRIALSLKWRLIALNSSNSSLGMLLQASDCYSEPNRIETAYKLFNEGYDWINSRYGIFYHIYLQKCILFDSLSVNSPVGLNMGLSMKIAKQLPEEIKYSSVDNWIYTSIMKIKPDAKIYIDETSDNWKYGVDTDGENIISKKRSENYTNIKPPFKETDINILDNLPVEIKNKLLHNSIIEQCYVCDSIKFFEDKIFNKFNFKNKRTNKNLPFDIDKNKPLLMFGCYGLGDFNVALNHNSLVLVVWAGSDSMQHNHENMKMFLGRNNIFHISGSKFISEDLDKIGLKYKYIPISLCDHSEIKSEILGDKIYIYTAKTHPYFYGKDIYDKLIEHYGEDRFIIANATTYTKDELYSLYKKCFIGLRLVKHDGLSETVAELGLMGRNII